MIDLANRNEIEFSSNEKLRFRKIVLDVLSESCSLDSTSDGIGTLGEKQMHAVIKRFVCSDKSRHEIKIDGTEGCISKKTETKKRGFVADILNGDTVYEIQTGSFAPLRDKIKWILENTTYKLTLIHPIAKELWIRYIDSDSGSIGQRRKSPKKGSLNDLISDLYYIREFIGSPRFSLVILFIEADSYKKKTAIGRRVRSSKYELIPNALLSAHIFKNRDDYKVFIPDTLPEQFTVKSYSEKSEIFGIDAYSIVKTLVYLDFFEECGHIGRAVAYKRKNSSINSEIQ